MTLRRLTKFGKLIGLGVVRLLVLLTLLGLIRLAPAPWQLVLLPTGIVLFLAKYAFQLHQLRWGHLARSGISPSLRSNVTRFGVARERAILSLRRPPRPWTIVLAAILLVAAIPLALAEFQGLCVPQESPPSPRATVPPANWTGVEYLASFLESLSFVLIEEFVFRGWLLFPIRKLAGPRTAVLITSYLFALGHLRPTGFVTLLFGGLVYGTAAVLTGSIWPAVALHLSYNVGIDGWSRLGLFGPALSIRCGSATKMFWLVAPVLFYVIWAGRRRSSR